MRCKVVLWLLLCCASGAQAETATKPTEGLAGFVSVDRLPSPDDPFLLKGRLVWGNSCQNCHGGNKATGAPKVTSTDAWAPRIEQGVMVLIDHALNGFVGPGYTQMPARGANPDLTDEEVTAAVVFMVWASGGADVVLDYLNKNKEREIDP